MALQPLTEKEFFKIRDLLVAICGIDLKPDQDYLVETRLTEVATEIGANTFGELHQAMVSDDELLNRVVDLMTTNETLWFRDDSCWHTIETAVLPLFLEKLKAGKKVRIWSSASSTGQEAYSFIITIKEFLAKIGLDHLISNIEIIGSDISKAALYLAENARYDPFTISRGMDEVRRDKYFTKENNSFKLKEEIKQHVTFQHFNLMNSFKPLGLFDLIFCRNVAIYFSREFKEELFLKISQSLTPDGMLLLGATESLFGLHTNFESQNCGNGIYFTLKE
ncbi:MAG: protein-glutamate O-methyltransferase CheR [SAR324 cluster bacterium]|nr:protein-glutamate O-methyltransferase CheR [SAR324 cluster bacterium]